MKFPLRYFMLSLCIPLMVACPGPIWGDPLPPPPSPEPHPVFSFGFHGSAIAGTYGVAWDAQTAPYNAPIRWHLDGGGTLLTPDRKSVDYSASDLPHSGYYVPPATIPESGQTVQIWFEIYNSTTIKWESSFKFPITVLSQTTPMGYGVPSGSPTSASILAGQKAEFTVIVNPRPLDFQQHTALISETQDAGTATLVPSFDTGWTLNYQAPASVPSGFNVIIQCIAFDPWFNVNRTVEFRVHVEP